MAIKIKANKLIKRLDCYRDGCDETYYIGFNAAIDRAVEIVESEAKKAKAKKKAKRTNKSDTIHAKWEISSDGYYPYCSSCKGRPEGKEMTRYCPNCGAIMDVCGKVIGPEE